MADVDTTPQQPETLGSMGEPEQSQSAPQADEQKDAATTERPQNDVAAANPSTDQKPGDGSSQQKQEENGGSPVAAATRDSSEGAGDQPALAGVDGLKDSDVTGDVANADADESAEKAEDHGGKPEGAENSGDDQNSRDRKAEELESSSRGPEEKGNETKTSNVEGKQTSGEAGPAETRRGEGEGKESGSGEKGGEPEPEVEQRGDPLPATPTFDDTDPEEEEGGGEEGRGQPIEKTKEKRGEERGGESERGGERAELESELTTERESTIVSSVRTPALQTLAANKRLTTTPLEGALPALKPHTAQLPPVVRGQVRGQQMTSAITDALKQGSQPSPKQLVRARRPPKYIRLTTVTVSPARSRPMPYGPSLYYEEPRRPKKVITWDEATNARPPLRIDMEGPTACSYTPRVKPLNETNAPSYTFGTKCVPEKSGGSRTSWSKPWFQTPHLWHTKVDFSRDGAWPSPGHYPKGSGLGPRQRTMPEAPSYTFGHKPAYSMVKPEASKEPSPNEYKRQTADGLVLRTGPSFTHQLRREGTLLWGAREKTPGPATYSPCKPGPERPSFTIQGIRREKSHVLGPYSTL